MERRYQVFISSTYTDLVDERREVIQAVLEMDCLPAGMEMFPAANEDQWTLIQEVIDQSDYYLVIVGGRYGSTTAEGISYTEKEYDYAVSQNIPIMGFVHANPGKIEKDKSDMDPETDAKLTAFREKVMGRMVKPYDSPKDLGSVVSRGLNRMIRRNPREGWVRGNEAMTPEVKTEIAELRAALSNLEKEKAEEVVGTSTALDTTFEHGSDTVTLKATHRGWGGVGNTSYGVEVTFEWDEIVQVIGPYMIDEASERDVRRRLEGHILEDVRQNPPGQTLTHDDLELSNESWGQVIVQLRALGMIRVGVKKRTVSDKSVYWMLTPAGDAYLVGLRATKRAPSTPPASTAA